jgi:hypothetical protein
MRNPGKTISQPADAVGDALGLTGNARGAALGVLGAGR